MWQMLLRNWLLGTARDKMREAAEQAATGARDAPKHAAQQAPPEPKPPDPCHVGLVFALGIEAGGLVDRLSGVIKTEGAGFVAREGGLGGRRLVVIESGIGCPAAARAAQALIQGHRPAWVISAGFAGGLDDRLAQGDILMADQIVDRDNRRLDIDFKLDAAAVAAARHLHVGRLLTTDRIIHDPAEKLALGQRYAALAVDMDSSAVADVCRNQRVRCLAIRVISDPAGRALPRDIDYLIKKKSTAGRLGAAAGAILRRPSSIKDMWQLKEDALVASDRLAAFLVGIVGQLK
jgi:adenosylhomocysteine nucleosidase